MKKTLSLVLALMLLLSFVACGNKADDSSTAGPVAEEVQGVTIPEFSVTVNGIAVDQTAMAAYPIYSVQATSTNSAGTESTTTYVGFAMKDVLAAAGLTEAYIWLEATADDGYAVTITGDTVLADTTLLAMTQDGDPFTSSPWLAPCASATTGDYLKGCVSILVNTTESAPDVAASSPSASGEKLALTGELPEIQDKTGKVDFAPFSFLVNGNAVTNDTLKDLSIYKITVTVANKSGELSESTYAGYKLADVLAACGIASPSSVKVKANDGYESELKSELITSEYTLVAIEQDKTVGEGGTIWIAPCSETESKSFCKLVVEITAK
ncbi:MAG: molybdopterin-dependent oxidoreductase [Oscillospiraceae bacterium]|nr:molybdopterin-dependent oxidoreductase [Oscillospiraceae bacterium]